jgi:hypothetical protein
MCFPSLLNKRKDREKERAAQLTGNGPSPAHLLPSLAVIVSAFGALSTDHRLPPRRSRRAREDKLACASSPLTPLRLSPLLSLPPTLAPLLFPLDRVPLPPFGELLHGDCPPRSPPPCPRNSPWSTTATGANGWDREPPQRAAASVFFLGWPRSPPRLPLDSGADRPPRAHCHCPTYRGESPCRMRPSLPPSSCP